MSLDYSAVPRMPDGRTALETIEAVAATSKAIKVPMGPSSAGGGGRQMWHVWGEGSGKPALLLFHGGSGSWIHWIRNVQPLSQHFTVYAADMPGLGDSDPSDDVRVNRLSLCLLQLFKEPLPSVLKRRIMDPIGASNGWRWEGYRNSTVTIDGKPMISVPGGGHWGGGIVISARDLALMGRLVAQGGVWNGQQLLPKGWTAELVKPCPVAPFYGLMWWLNTDRRQFATASERSYFAFGWGSHIVWIDPDNDLVTVLRWIERKQAGGFVERLLGAIKK